LTNLLTKLLAAGMLLCAPGMAAAQMTPLPADDPAARWAAGLIEPLLAGDEAKALEFLRGNLAEGANVQALEASVKRIIEQIKGQEGAHLISYVRFQDDVAAELGSKAGLRMLVGIRGPDQPLAIAALLSSPQWVVPPGTEP
jgi:hypothetical protein